MAHVLVVFARRLRTCIVTTPRRRQDRVAGECDPSCTGSLRRPTPARLRDCGSRNKRYSSSRVRGRARRIALRAGKQMFRSTPQRFPFDLGHRPPPRGVGLWPGTELRLRPQPRSAHCSPRTLHETRRRPSGSVGTSGQVSLGSFDAAQSDWLPIREAMELANDAEPGELWRSLWEVTGISTPARPDTPAGQLLKDCALGK